MEHIEDSSKYKGLSVSKGIEQPPTTNPYLLKKQFLKKKKSYSVEDFVDGIKNGDLSILSQAVTLVESSRADHQFIAQQVIEKCLPFSGRSIRLGITGVPGAGKSTFIEALGMHLVDMGKKLAVLAIDPSSERTKGSILGDKTRMEDLSRAKNAFIRPSPSAGSLGGVARKTREIIVLCEAAGFDTIFVETVGVGQSETAVHSMVDFFLLIQIAGAGDELQGIKRGIMEMTDGIAINKADGNNIEKAQMAKAQLENALRLFPQSFSGWHPRVLTCSSIDKNGIGDVWHMISEYVIFVQENDYFSQRRREQSAYWMYETINERLKSDFYNNEKIQSILKEYELEVLNDKKSSFIAARDLLDFYDKQKK